VQLLIQDPVYEHVQLTIFDERLPRDFDKMKTSMLLEMMDNYLLTIAPVSFIR
jgi:hypothetical protein